MSKQITVSITYLTPVEIETGRPAKQGDGHHVLRLRIADIIEGRSM